MERRRAHKQLVQFLKPIFHSALGIGQGPGYCMCQVCVASRNSVEYLERPLLLDKVLDVTLKGNQAIPVHAYLRLWVVLLDKFASSYELADRGTQSLD